MASNTKKWLLGCGLGCGVMILIFAIILGGGFIYVRNIIQDVQHTEAVMDDVTAQYGQVRDFTPNFDGTISTDRLKLFLAVRDGMASERAAMEETLALLEEGQGKMSVSPLKVMKMVRAGTSLIPHIFNYITRRNEVLLDQGMGLGEYTYIYVLAYYVWLGKSPADGPSFVLMGSDEDEDEHEHHWQWDHDDDEVYEERREIALRYLSRQLLAMLRNQRDELEGVLAGMAPAERVEWDQWLESLDSEIAAMAAEKQRLPWIDGLPTQTLVSLSPYRAPLLESYSGLCNPLELGIRQDD